MKFLVFFLLILKILFTFEEYIGCEPCLGVVNEIKNLDKNEVNIYHKLAAICEKITLGKQPYDSACKKYMVHEIDTIMLKIEQLKDPNLVCSDLNFC
uniref:Saposin B-type domain-containing protein n=1 Tax=Strongyloides papillosus TaxID=174720 RepID=A0A0N5CA96_STREA